LSVGTLSGVLTASASRQQSAEAAVREARTRLAAALRNGETRCTVLFFIVF